MRSFPLNGGCRSDTGDLVLRFKRDDGVEFEIIVPYDKSLATAEMLKRAAKQASEHKNNIVPDDSIGENISTNWQVYDAKDVLLAHEPETGTPLLSIRSTEDFQISFKVDQKIFENIGFHRAGIQPLDVSGPFSTVAIDIDYFQKIWGTTYKPPSGIELRWSVAALRRLLIEGFIGRAWRHVGFEKEPVIPSPDILRFLKIKQIEPQHVAVMFAGGGSIDGVEFGISGLARTYNPSTGKGPDSEEGFAVANLGFARDSRSDRTPSEHDDLLYKPTLLTEFLTNPSIIRRGQSISRRDFLQYYAKWGGGVHLDEAKGVEATAIIELINEVQGNHEIFGMSGSDFELFSIGHLLAKSPDLERLKQALIGRSGA